MAAMASQQLLLLKVGFDVSFDVCFDYGCCSVLYGQHG
jgi:hypothetical protein